MKTILRTGALIGLVAVLQGCAEKAAREASPLAPAAPAQPAATAQGRELDETVLDPKTRGWEAGHEYDYQAKSTTFVQFGSGPSAFDFDLSGTFHVFAVKVASEEAILSATIPNAKIESRVQRSQSELDKVARELSTSYAFIVFAGGHVKALRTPPGMSPTVANAFRTFAAALQFERPMIPTDAYETREYDSTGRYMARYELDRSQSVWSKRKIRYIDLLTPKTTMQGFPSRVLPEVVTSSGKVALSSAGVPLTVESDDELLVNGAQVPVRTRSKVALAAVSSQPAEARPRDWSALLASTTTVSANEPYLMTSGSLDPAKIGDLTFDRVLKQLEARDPEADRGATRVAGSAAGDPAERARAEANIKDESRLFMALSAILRSQPETVSLAERRIRAHSPASADLIDALGSASSVESEKALVDLSNAVALDEGTRARALAALTRTPHPTQGSIEALEALLAKDPYSGAALLGLGTYSRHLRDAGDAAGAARIGNMLAERLRPASEQGEGALLTVLRAIANSGYTPALRAVSGYLRDSRDQVRVAAVRSLQSMQTGDVDSILAERIQTDTSGEVRSSAIAAAKVRGPCDVLVRAISASATAADDPHVRYDAVKTLSAWLNQRPEVRGALERVATTDQEVRIREFAKAAL